MSGSVNKAIVVGNLGGDPDVRQTQQGVKVVSFSVATSESWRDRNSGERREKTQWHRITVWGSLENDGLAGIAEKYLKKGSKVYLAGQMETREWTDNQGIKRYTTEVVLKGFNGELTLLDSKGDSSRPPHPASNENQSNNQSSARPQAAQSAAFESGGADDDIPF